MASASSATIKAGGSEVFKFDYHAPTGFADERRWVTVTVGDPALHDIKLIATAWVRPIMAARVSTLNFGNISLADDAGQSLELGNFGSEDWDSVELIDPPAWLSVQRSLKIQGHWTGASPRETWSLDLQVATASLKSGSYRQEARFRSTTGDLAAVWVEFVAGVPVQARPSLFMLGQTDAGKSVDAMTVLSFFGGSPPCRPDQVSISATGAKIVGHEIVPIKPDLWKLKVRLDPIGNPGDFISGELAVSFPGGAQSGIAIPIRGQIRQRP